MHTNVTTLLGQKNIHLAFTDKPVTPWGGLVVFVQFAKEFGLPELLRSHLPFTITSPNARDPVETMLAFACGVLTGARRFSHLERHRYDQALRQLFGFKDMFPCDDTIINLLRRFRRQQIEEVFLPLYRWQMEKLPQRPEGYTLDLDSSVFERYGKQEGAKKGYNPKKRGRPSHHPIFGVLAETLTIAHVWLRSGNTGSRDGGDLFLTEILANLPSAMTIGALRADSGFAYEPFLAFVESKAFVYACAARFTKGLQAKTTTVTDWKTVDHGIEAGEVLFQAQGWSKARRVVFIRKHAPDLEEARGKTLFNDKEYRWDAIVTNGTDAPEEIWRFYRGRSNIENRIKELKWDWGADGFCLKKFHSTEAAFRFICWLHNIMVMMGKRLGFATHKTLSTLRHQIFVCGAILGRTGSRLVLRLSLQGRWRERFLGYMKALSSSQNINFAKVDSG